MFLSLSVGPLRSYSVTRFWYSFDQLEFFFEDIAGNNFELITYYLGIYTKSMYTLMCILFTDAIMYYFVAKGITIDFYPS